MCTAAADRLFGMALIWLCVTALAFEPAQAAVGDTDYFPVTADGSFNLFTLEGYSNGGICLTPRIFKGNQHIGWMSFSGAAGDISGQSIADFVATHADGDWTRVEAQLFFRTDTPLPDPGTDLPVGACMVSIRCGNVGGLTEDQGSFGINNMRAPAPGFTGASEPVAFRGCVVPATRFLTRGDGLYTNNSPLSYDGAPWVSPAGRQADMGSTPFLFGPHQAIQYDIRPEDPTTGLFRGFFPSFRSSSGTTLARDYWALDDLLGLFPGGIAASPAQIEAAGQIINTDPATGQYVIVNNAAATGQDPRGKSGATGWHAVPIDTNFLQDMVLNPENKGIAFVNSVTSLLGAAWDNTGFYSKESDTSAPYLALRVVATPMPGQARWVAESPVLGTSQLKAIWGTASNNVFAVGDYGTIAHFGGQHWSAMVTGTTNTLRAIWGTGPNDIYAVGDYGTILRYDGASWSPVASGTYGSLVSIWGSSPSSIYVVSMEGGVHHYDGSTWSRETVTGTGGCHYGIWGSGPNDIYVAAGAYVDGGAIRHYDGSSWTTIAAPFPVEAVWGSGPDDVYAAGAVSPDAGSLIGRILHYDGTAWTTLPLSVEGMRFTGLWGTGPNDVYALSNYMNDGIRKSSIVHYDGTTWSTVARSFSDNLGGIWGSSRDSIHAVGGHFNMSVYQFMPFLAYYNGDTWSLGVEGTGHGLADVWGSGPGDVFAVGDSGTVMHYNGSHWTAMDSGTGANLNAIWGSGPDDVYAVGGKETILHYNGSAWSIVMQGSEWACMYDIWGSGFDDIFVIAFIPSNDPGHRYKILHYDGSAWSVMLDGTPGEVSKLAGSGPADVYAMGSEGAMLHYDGTTWSNIGSIDTPWVHGIWSAGPGSLYAVGYEWQRNLTTITRYDGTSWSIVFNDCDYVFDLYRYGIWGTSPANIFTVGMEGKILHCGNGAWLPMNSGTTRDLHSVWGSGPRNVYAVGDGGTILHYSVPGDVNGDGAINVGDLQSLVAAWGTLSMQSAFRGSADINRDGCVNVGDLQLLVSNWGR